MVLSEKNYAFFSDTYLPIIGGVQFQLYWLFQEIDNCWDYYKENYGFDNIYFITQNQNDDTYLQFKNIKVIQYNFSKSGKLRYLKLLWTIYYSVKKNKIGRMHVSHAMVEGFVARIIQALTGMRYMATSWGQDFAYDTRFGYGARLNKKIEKFLKFNMGGASYVTTISKDMCKFVKEIVPDDKVKLVYCAKEYHSATYAERDTQKEILLIRDELKIPEGYMVCLTLSGSREIKGHKNMLVGFSKALKHYPNMVLLIGGKGEQIDQMKEFSKELNMEDSVRFIGYIRDLRKHAFMRLTDVYLNTAYFEPFGLVYVQAIEYKIAVVASNNGGGKDIFTHKENGFLINPDSSDEIADGILHYVDSEIRKKITENALPELKRFECSTIVGQYLDIFKKM